MTFDPFGRWVRLSCKATVAGEELEVSLMVVEPVYRDPIAREAVEKRLRHALMDMILEKWTPKIHVRR